MDRAAINHALAKALSYKACGKDALADQWGKALVVLLLDAGIRV